MAIVEPLVFVKVSTLIAHSRDVQMLTSPHEIPSSLD